MAMNKSHLIAAQKSVIGMLIDDDVSPLPVYDTTDLHAKALVDHALR